MRTNNSRRLSAILACATLPFFAMVAACAPAADKPADEEGTGGASTATGGATVATGGSGAVNTGGAPGTGGSSSGTGGSVSGTGGAPTPSTGGSSPAGSGGSSTGGAAPSGGRGGGPAASGGAAGGGMAAGGAGPVGTAGMGGPTLCPTAGTILCDGFEGTAPGAGSDWTTMGTITVDATRAYRGTKSVKFMGSAAYILEKKTFTGATKATNNSFWARYFFLSGQTGTPPATHTWFGALADAANSGNQFHFAGGSRGILQAEIRIGSDQYTDAQQPAANTTSPKYPTMADGWQCWEFHVQADDSFNFFISGKEIVEMKIVAGKASKSGA
ncbi:MAG: hypothetical protein ABUR63_02200, partial [Verrucomicrobiota bacterium]